MLRRLPQTPRRLLRRGRGALNVLLMSVPPVFNIALVSLLSYYTVHHNNDSVIWALFAAFIDAQLLFNWIQFLRFQSYVLPSKRNFPGKTSFFGLVFWYFVMKCHLFSNAKAKLVLTNFDGFLNDQINNNNNQQSLVLVF